MSKLSTALFQFRALTRQLAFAVYSGLGLHSILIDLYTTGASEHYKEYMFVLYVLYNPFTILLPLPPVASSSE